MKGSSILLVDDEAVVLDMYVRLLKEQGYKNVTTAKSGTEAIELIQNSHHDLVITDLRMDGHDGFQVLKAAKTRNPSTKAIVLTGYASTDSAIKAFQNGASDYHIKPVSGPQFDKIISNCLDQIKQKEIDGNKMNDYIQELQKSNRDLENYSATICHEIKAPLRKIMLFSDRLKVTSKNLDAKEIEKLDRIIKSAQQLNHLTEDLLQLSLIQKLQKQFIKVDLYEIILDILDEFDEELFQSQGTIDLGDMPVIEGDPTQLRILFKNFISNAFKFTQEHTSPVIGLCSSYDGKGNWSIRVQDNGIGFDVEYAENLFQPFQRLHKKDSFKGSGLGLTIAKSIVDQHQGKITVRSTPETGTTFIITLPEKQSEKNC